MLGAVLAHPGDKHMDPGVHRVRRGALSQEGTLAGGFVPVHPHPLETMGQMTIAEIPGRAGECLGWPLAAAGGSPRADTAEVRGNEPKGHLGCSKTRGSRFYTDRH